MAVERGELQQGAHHQRDAHVGHGLCAGHPNTNSYDYFSRCGLETYSNYLTITGANFGTVPAQILAITVGTAGTPDETASSTYSVEPTEIIAQFPSRFDSSTSAKPIQVHYGVSSYAQSPDTMRYCDDAHWLCSLGIPDC